MDWSLLGCGAGGHITYAPDEPLLRDRLSVTTGQGTAWKCLRCGTFVIGGAAGQGPAAKAPKVRRGNEIRSTLILRFFAVERVLRALVFGVLAYGIWRFKTSRLTIEQAYSRELPALKALYRGLGLNVNHSKLLGFIHHAFTLNVHTLTYLAIGAAAYAVIELVEAVGLWLAKRWGEYFAMIVTSLGLPYEIYELANKVTVLRIVAFALNLALVLYLVIAKRLFGVRGGKKAYEAKLRSASIIQEEIDALSAAEAAKAAAQAAEAAKAAAQAAVAGKAGQPGPSSDTAATSSSAAE